jgi:hypothetical protein
VVGGVDGWYRTSSVGQMAIKRWIFAFCNFQLRACKKLLPPQQPPAPSPDVLIASRVSFYSAVMCTKRLPIGFGKRWSVEGVTSVLRDTLPVELVVPDTVINQSLPATATAPPNQWKR